MRSRSGFWGRSRNLLEGAPVGLGTRKQRAVLALLALQPNATVPTDRLIDDLWGDQPPASARAVLQTYVAGLRKGLDGTGLEVETRGPGYALAIDPLAVDTERFQRLVTAARKQAAAGERAVAAAALREALGLWRGRALEDFGSEPGLEDWGERLEARASPSPTPRSASGHTGCRVPRRLASSSRSPRQTAPVPRAAAGAADARARLPTAGRARPSRRTAPRERRSPTTSV